MTSHKILLFGKNGQLGWELHRSLIQLGEVIAVSRVEADFENPDSAVDLIRRFKPQFIINPVAYTAVDLAEVEEARAFQVNAVMPAVLAEEARKLDSVFIHYSTDYVFDGTKQSPYVESDATNPLNVYGQSKLSGEQAIGQVGGAAVILRTSWVYSLRQNGGFVRKVLQWSRQQSQLRMVTDQVGNPTWSRALAEVTALLFARGDGYLRERIGLYHLAGRGLASRFDWANAILAMDPNRHEQIATEILPALTNDFPLPAERPLYSALDCAKFERVFDFRLPDWKSALYLAMH